MSVTAYPTLRMKLTMPQALKLQFLPAIPGGNVSNKVNRTGDTMTGQLILSADPALALEAATKQYVDAHAIPVVDGDKGDITVSGSGAIWTIDPNAVTYAKMQDVSATQRLLLRKTTGPGDVEEGTLSEALDFVGSAAQGDFLYRGSTAWTRLAAGSSGQFLQTQGTGANPVWATPAGGGSTSSQPQGRLTLQTGTPVMTTTQSAKTTIFYTPYVGNTVPIYNGSNMVATSFTELSVATTDTTKSPAAIGTSKVNDWFVWSDAGTLRIGHGPDWTSDTVRSAGTALVKINGIWLNNASITNGPAAQRGTYVGTTRSNAASQLDFQFGGVLTFAAFGVWNCYNRIRTSAAVTDNTSSWTYGSSTYRQRRADSSASVSFVMGLAEDTIEAMNFGGGNTDSSTNSPINGIALDTSTNLVGCQTQSNNFANGTASFCARWDGTAFGFHSLIAVEAANNAGAPTWFGLVAGPPARQVASFNTVLFL